MKSITDARTIYENSNMIRWNHGKYQFNEEDFIRYFWINYKRADELMTAFVEHMSKTNDVPSDIVEAVYFRRGMALYHLIE